MSFNTFTKKKTCQKKTKPNKQKKPINLQGYYQTICCACKHITYSKKSTKGPSRAQRALMKHHIFCPEFNNLYFEEFKKELFLITGTKPLFLITTLKEYARSYAFHAKVVDSEKLNNN